MREISSTDFLEKETIFSQTGGECDENAVSIGSKCWNLTNTAKLNYSKADSCALPSRDELDVLRPNSFEDILPKELSNTERFWLEKSQPDGQNDSICQTFWSDTFDIEHSSCNS